MRGRKLNAWYRAAIVLSALWAVGAGMTAAIIDRQQMRAFANRMYGYCADDPVAQMSGRCGEELFRLSNSAWPTTLIKAASTAIIPLMLAWLGIAIAVPTVRWILAGRASKEGWFAKYIMFKNEQA